MVLFGLNGECKLDAYGSKGKAYDITKQPTASKCRHLSYGGTCNQTASPKNDQHKLNGNILIGIIPIKKIGRHNLSNVLDRAIRKDIAI